MKPMTPKTTQPRQQQIERIKKNAFYGGVLSVIWMLGPPNEAARETVLVELGDSDARELIAFAKRNGEYRSSGLAKAASYVMRPTPPQKGRR